MISIVTKSRDDGVVPNFEPGQVVLHRRYGYRGVIVAVDPRCMADDAWYYANQTQPNRDQPWYHVLVDGSSQTTYPAEDSLQADTTGELISHPLLEHFFIGFVQGRYVRNEEPWPGS